MRLMPLARPATPSCCVSYGADPIPELKRQLAAELVRAMGPQRAWDVAVLIGTDQPRVSDLRRGKLDRFSVESLIRFLARLGRCLELRVERRAPGPRSSGNAHG